MYFINGARLGVDEFRFRGGKNLNASREIEVHKLEDGSIRLVGFIPSGMAHNVRELSDNIRFTLYNTAWARADYLISLPVVAVGKVHDLRLIPIGDKRDGCLALDLELKLD